MNLRKKASVLLDIGISIHCAYCTPLNISGGGVQENKLRDKHIILQLNHINSKFLKTVQEGSS